MNEYRALARLRKAIRIADWLDAREVVATDIAAMDDIVRARVADAACVKEASADTWAFVVDLLVQRSIARELVPSNFQLDRR